MNERSTHAPVIRKIAGQDLERIIEIDTKVLGQARPEYWEKKLELAEKRSPVSSLVAEIEGNVIGFIMGDANGWEYGAPENVGWIDTIGVDPDFQRMGIAKILFTEMISNLKKVGVEAIYTFVAWRDWTLLTFFDEMGFEKGDMINLELKI
ncbi:GNAT family N-acetyltransferase [Thermodesulfobacteriota bacterium]